MKKNVAGQLISAQMTSASDGSEQTTGTCNVAVEIDGVAGTGGTATHVANGKWEYAPIQADTNGDQVDFQFKITGAITVLQVVYPQFPQTGDSYARIGALGAGLTDLTTATQAEIEAGCNDALTWLELDTLLKVAATPGNIVDNSVIARLVSASATPAFSDFVNTTDSLQANRDHATTVKTAVDAIPTTAMRGTDNAATEAKQDTAKTAIDAIKVITDALTEAAAANLAISAGVMVPFTVTGIPTTTEVAATGLTALTGGDNVLIGRVIIMTSGVRILEAARITDYVDSTGAMTVTAMSGAVSAADTGIII